MFRVWLIRRLLRGQRPISEVYGLDRGQAVDRYYIERFLEENASDITGQCLELLSADYTTRFGGDRVTHSDVLDIDHSNRGATIYGDLRNLERVPSETYDCIILTQVLQFVDDYEAATRECHRILKRGGVILATVPTLSRLDVAAGPDADYWRFAPAGAKCFFGRVFGTTNIRVDGYGNVLAGLGFWIGLSQEDLETKDLEYLDPNFPCIVTVRATKE